MSTAHIVFIGGGNMAISLIAGLLANQHPADKISVAEPDTDKCQQLQQQFNIQTFTDNEQAIAQADVLVLAIKPQIMQIVCKQAAAAVAQSKPLIISIAAGIRGTDIDRWLGGQNALVRCMPNTPSLLQLGASGLFANAACSAAQKQQADHILAAAGITLWVDNEQQLDAVTAVSGSGPAYFFLLIEAMQAAGEKLGLSANTAQQLSIQTALGAASMAKESDVSPAELRTRVTSKGGTTAAAIEHFQQHDFEPLVEAALSAARNRAIELADILGKDT